MSILPASLECSSMGSKSSSPQQSVKYFAAPIGLPTLSLLVAIELSIILWTVCDHSLPCWDTAAHRLNSLSVYELLKHPHIARIHWYRSIFSVGQLYPPFFYMVSATLKFVCGALADTELLSNLIFVAILFFSLYYIGHTVGKDKLSATLAASLVFLYPGVFWSTHCALLDCAANGMVGLGLACLIWWANQPSLRRSIILGIALGLSALTKNNTPIFFVGPLLVEIFFALRRQENGKRDYARIKQLSITAAVGFLTILPWLILAGSTVLKFVSSVQQQNFRLDSYVATAQSTDISSYANDLIAQFVLHLKWFTLLDLPLILSPLLLGCFLIALPAAKPYSKEKAYLVASIVFSIFIASAFRWPHQFRYIVPVAVPMSVLTANMFSRAWMTGRLIWRASLVTVLCIALMQFVRDGFTPYPIHLPGWASEFMNVFAGNSRTINQGRNLQGVSRYPLPDIDWGVKWVLSNIEEESGGKPTSLLVMPSTDSVNCSFYCYMVKARKDGVEVAMPRQLTELGDQVCFDPKRAIWYQWCLLKTGDQGREFYDAESKAAYDKWCKFIRYLKVYQLFKTKLLPDGSVMQLYRREQ